MVEHENFTQIEEVPGTATDKDVILDTEPQNVVEMLHLCLDCRREYLVFLNDFLSPLTLDDQHDNQEEEEPKIDEDIKNLADEMFGEEDEESLQKLPAKKKNGRPAITEEVKEQIKK